MNIYIPGMEMPKSCWECPMVSGYEIANEAKTVCSTVRCRLTNTKRPAGEAIAPNCPLVPVPSHGRLGDLDALIEKVIVKYLEHERKGELVFAAAEIKQDIVDIISDTPTNIPADKEGEG